MTVKAIMLTVRAKRRQVNYELVIPENVKVGDAMTLNWGFADPADSDLRVRLMPAETEEIEQAILAAEGIGLS